MALNERAPILGVAAGLTAALAAAHALPAAAQPFARLRRLYGIDDTTPQTGVALTFDDGPHPEGTPLVLDALAARGATATFFLVGEQAARWPRLARAIADAGHTIGLHGQRHRNLLRLTPRQTRRDLERGWEVVAEAAGTAPTLYRPPYGVFSAAALAVARRRGWRPLLWTHWGRDWERRATAQSIADRVTDGVREGSVMLLHDADHYSAPGSWLGTAAAVPHVLDRLSQLDLPVVAA